MGGSGVHPLATEWGQTSLSYMRTTSSPKKKKEKICHWKLDLLSLSLYMYTHILLYCYIVVSLLYCFVVFSQVEFLPKMVFCFDFFETGSYCIAVTDLGLCVDQTGLELWSACLLLPPKCWGYKCTLSYLAYSFKNCIITVSPAVLNTIFAYCILL